MLNLEVNILQALKDHQAKKTIGSSIHLLNCYLKRCTRTLNQYNLYIMDSRVPHNIHGPCMPELKAY